MLGCPGLEEEEEEEEGLEEPQDVLWDLSCCQTPAQHLQGRNLPRTSTG